MKIEEKFLGNPRSQVVLIQSEEKRSLAAEFVDEDGMLRVRYRPSRMFIRCSLGLILILFTGGPLLRPA